MCCPATGNFYKLGLGISCKNVCGGVTVKIQQCVKNVGGFLVTFFSLLNFSIL